ncbi:MAG: peptidase M16 [Deltaproteobacteria bacterium RIFOXYD12_FULL_57_12]|nr:MAG: peptidase M16 [Deltaproteobacteria bacterium RIFOXYD12_FULL_57_12]
MYNKTILENGLRIITERLPHSRLTSVGIWVDVGSRDEHDLNNGSAHFVEHMLFKGTRNRTAEQLARELDVLGGTANAFTARDTTCYYATVLDRHLPKLVELFADLFLNSRFDQEDIDKERQVILQEISMVEDTPDDQIHDLFAALLWGRHPLGNTVLGGREVVAAMDAKKLIDYVQKQYTPDRILIAAAGNVEHDAFVRLWQDAASLPAGSGDAPPARRPPQSLSPQRAIYSKPLEQVHVLLGTYGPPAASVDRFTFMLLNVLLGGNMSSRLFQELREKRGLAYSIYSYIVPFADCGYLSIYLGVDREVVNEALSLVVREVNRLVNEPVSAAELADAREFSKAGLYLAAENMESIMMRIARNEFVFGHYVTFEEVATAIDQVQPVDIGRLAGQIFANDLTMTALGPLQADEVDWALLGWKK